MEAKRWHFTARPALRLVDRLRLLVGMPLYVRFESPDGRCHAACSVAAYVQREWPADSMPVPCVKWPRL